MIHKTSHRQSGIQMKIHQNKELAQIMYGHDQNFNQRSFYLQFGKEYTIEVSLDGQVSTETFKDLTLDQRRCRLDHEVIGSKHQHYSRTTCLYDCHVKM